MAFEAKDYPISDILTKAVFDIPRNQRRYVWKEENWQDLYEDIVFSITESKPHFIGSIVLEGDKKENGLSYYTIIDGQQRITTITIALLAIMKLFYEKDMKNEFLGTVSYLQSKNNSNIDIIILNSEYHSSLASLIKGIISLDDTELSISSFVDTHILSKARDKSIGDAIKFFYVTIKDDIEKNGDPKKRLIDIRNAVLDMTVVRIVSNSEEDSYTIFEILNARGQELAPHELLKNYIMRYIQPTERRDEAKSKWEEMEQLLGTSMNRFVKHYATHRFGDTKNKYTSPYQAIKKATRGEKISELFDDIKLKSEYYNRIIHPQKDGVDITNVEMRIFSFFKVKKFEQFRPILISLIHQTELGHLSSKKYELVIKYIYNFFVCYTIIGEGKSNKLEDVVFKYASLIENSYSDKLLQEFADALKAKIPGYDWFLNSFRNIGWSNHFDLYKGEKNKQRVKIVLEVVEQYFSQRDCLSDFTIEHMLSDADSIRNSQIGNLIPLEEALNRRCKTKTLNDKLEIYSESGYSSARNIVKRYKNQELDVESRTAFMAKLIYNNILELNQFDYSTR